MMAARTGSIERATRRLLLLLTGAVYCFAGESLQVTAVRFWSLGEVTRIAVETDAAFTFRTDRLHKPERIFFDLKDAHPKFVSKGIYTIPVDDPRVKQIRVAETSPGVTRVVVDLMDPELEVNTSQLSVPDRLMIEVKLKGAALTPGPTLSTSGMRRIPRRTVGPTPPAKPFDPPVIQSAAKLDTFRSPAAGMKLPSAPPLSTPSLSTPPLTVVAAKTPVSVPAVVPPKMAKRNSNGDRTLTRALGLKLRRIVIDPGHGGNDHGTTGPGGLTEKELVLDVSRRVAALVEEGLGSEVVFTRTNDTYIGLEDRPAIANANKADLFLSIHANSSPIKSVSGVETYILSFTTSRAAMELAARENASSTKSISDLKELLQKIALKDKVDESREFAAKVQTALTGLYPAASKNAPASTAPRRDRGIKRAPFIVLIGAQMPAILTEIGFVTNSREEQQLMKPEYRQKIAEAIYQGVEQYADTLSRFEMAQTSKRTGTE
ncbi:MAG: N-acetylmuramoyl-L-alanine amidase [Acidobacteria bacterium]|nr:N-acetylmuramoyl-L-alanine amidase [Acidobacteriota bacterium]